jgi:tRNA (adenine22-N1)-methyltransferase
MEKLEQKLRQFFPPNSEESSWYAHTVGAEQCPISNYPGKHLVIVSGVGGELAASIVQQLHETYSAHEVDFLICPTNHTFLVRQELMRCKMGLVSERLIEDNKYFYELILLRQNKVSPLCTTHNETVKPACDEQALNTTPEKTLSAAGEALWQGDPEIAAAYLAQLKQHYSRLLNSNREFATTALEAYGRVSL